MHPGTTELDFHGQDTDGLGALSCKAQRGMYASPTAVSPEREPLGVLDAWMWVRGDERQLSRALPAGAKESCCWVEGYWRLAEKAGLLSDTRLVDLATKIIYAEAG